MADGSRPAAAYGARYEHDPATAEHGAGTTPGGVRGDGLMSASRLTRFGADVDARAALRRRRRNLPERIALVAIELVVALGAVYGGLSLLADPDELGVDHAWLDGSVFPDYTIPGLVLLVVIGGGMLIAAAVAVWAPRKAGLAAEVMAAALLVWGTVETFTIGWRGTTQLVLIATFVVAPAIALVFLGRRLEDRR
jgi:hypothetical protein